jgi:hypothetical protein
LKAVVVAAVKSSGGDNPSQESGVALIIIVVVAPGRSVGVMLIKKTYWGAAYIRVKEYLDHDDYCAMKNPLTRKAFRRRRNEPKRPRTMWSWKSERHFAVNGSQWIMRPNNATSAKFLCTMYSLPLPP